MGGHVPNIVHLPQREQPLEPPREMWHVILTVAGAPVPSDMIKDGLEKLAHDHPFLLSGRFANDRAEVRYWEEADCIATVISLAEKLWEEHRVTAELPNWRVVGVEVLDRDTFHRRGAAGLVSAGGIGPF